MGQIFVTVLSEERGSGESVSGFGTGFANVRSDGSFLHGNSLHCSKNVFLVLSCLSFQVFNDRTVLFICLPIDHSRGREEL